MRRTRLAWAVAVALTACGSNASAPQGQSAPTAAERLEEARQLERGGDRAGAEKVLRELLPNATGEVATEVEERLVSLVLARGDLDGALGLLAEAAKARPEDASPQFRRGVIALEAGRFEVSREALERAASLSPDTPAIDFRLGVARRQTGDRGGALEALARAVAADAKHVEARHELCWTLGAAERWAEAATCMDVLVKLAPSDERKKMQARAREMAASATGLPPAK